MDGARVVKLFLHVSAKEQLRRFRERLDDPVKRWKLTAEDFRNRGRREAYLEAYHDMFDRTSTRAAPWCAVDGDDKWTARIETLEYVIRGLSKGVPMESAPVDGALAEAVADAERRAGLKTGKRKRR